MGLARKDGTIKLALAQMPPSEGDADLALAWIETALGAAAVEGADLLVVPELVLPGYNCPDLHVAAAQPRGGDWQEVLSGWATKHGVALIYGWAERAGDDLYNAASAIGADGRVLAHYRKLQLFGDMERSVFTPGTAAPPVFGVAGRRVGLLICYDVEFPEHVRGLARAGADLVAVPTANPVGYEQVQKLLVPARACENGVAVGYANYCGSERGLAFNGRSLVAGPDGAVLAAAEEAPTLLVVDVPARSDYASGALSSQLGDINLPE
ncbi:MAG: carbon-nitrogen hydrolase family protein [Pseudomonadota bacterium]